MVAIGDQGAASTGSVALNGHRFDLEANELLDQAGERIPLRPQCLAVLRCLVGSAGRVVDRADLMRAVWPGVVVTDDSLVQCIGELRRVLGDARHRVVRTEHRRGYRLMPSPGAGADLGTNGMPAQQVRFATSGDGVRIAYACLGDGVPVVRSGGFSHLGYDMDCLTEGPLLREMASRYRLLRFDGRGRGLSDRHVTSFSIEDTVRDLLAVVDAEGLSRFVLWANGAMSPIRFAALYPERVERLILSDTQARGLAHRRDDVWGNTDPTTDVLVETLWADENSTIRSGGGPHRLTRDYPTGTPEQQRSHDRLKMLASSGTVAVALWHAARYWSVSADLERIRCPTLVLHSQRNRKVLLEEAEFLASRIPDARLVLLDTDNCMPLPQEPAFDELLRQMEGFIAEGAPAWQAPAPGESAQ